MKVFQNMKAMLLSIGLAIGVGTIGFAMFANAQSATSSNPASQVQKDGDKETNDDTKNTTDNHQDGETNDDGAMTKSPAAN